MAKAKVSKGRGSRMASERMKKVVEEVTGGPITITPESTSPSDLAALRMRVIEAHRSGSREELDAAVKALMDAGETSPPAEARGTLVRWGM